jgi:hypothetical protein
VGEGEKQRTEMAALNLLKPRLVDERTTETALKPRIFLSPGWAQLNNIRFDNTLVDATAQVNFK